MLFPLTLSLEILMKEITLKKLNQSILIHIEQAQDVGPDKTLSC